MEHMPRAASPQTLATTLLRAGAGAWRVQGAALRLDTPAADDARPAPIKLLLAVRGTTELRERRWRLVLQPGQFTLLDAAEGVSLEAGTFEHVLIALPRGLALSRRRTMAADTWRLHAHAPEDALVRDFALMLARHAPQLAPPALHRSLGVLSDLLDSALDARRSTPESALLQRVQALLDLDLGELDATALAVRLKVSRRYLDKALSACGHTASGLIWERRLQQAAWLLREQRARPVTEICHALGFKDASHFARRFQRHFGSTPSAWRRSAAPTFAA